MKKGTFGAVYKTSKCCCEPQDLTSWEIIEKHTIRSGKNCGKVKALIHCNKCNRQWETSAKYIESIK